MSAETARATRVCFVFSLVGIGGFVGGWVAVPFFGASLAFAWWASQ